MKTIIIALLLLTPFALVFADAVSFGDISVNYDDTLQTESATLYYENDALVASQHDTDGNGDADLWLRYEDDVLVLEMHDTDGNGEPDVFLDIDANEAVTSISGEGSEALTPPEAPLFEARSVGQGGNAKEDLVGDLSSISIPGQGGFMKYVLLLLVIGGGYYYWKRREPQSAQHEETLESRE